MEKEQYPQGFEIPIHRSITRPIFWGGVPRNLLISEILVGILGAVFFKTWIIPVLAVISHFIFRYLGQKDPQFLEVFWRSKDYEDYYHP